MSKTVLISIRPEWCEKIALYQKTIEIRKTRPKIEEPFKCYIYCTQDNPLLGMYNLGYFKQLGRHPKEHFEGVGFSKDFLFKANGRVIGEFICDRIIKASPGDYHVFLPKRLTALYPHELSDYADGKTLYGWHISDLVIYDKPKELREFRKPGYRTGYKIVNDNKRGVVSVPFNCENVHLNRPPQSWCYVEELI